MASSSIAIIQLCDRSSNLKLTLRPTKVPSEMIWFCWCSIVFHLEPMAGMESIVLCHQFCEWSNLDDQFTLKGMILFLSYQWDKSGCARCLTAIWHHRDHSLPEEFLDWRRQMVQAGHWTWNKPRSAISVIGIHQILIKLCFLFIAILYCG